MAEVQDKSLEDLQLYDLKTQRLEHLIDFVGHPIQIPNADDPDPDIISAYTLAVLDCLKQIRKLANE